MNTDTVHIGVDMAEDSFDAALPAGILHLSNTAAGFRALLREVRKLDRDVCVYVEATGGCEQQMCDFLLTHGIAVAKVNPKRVRDFAHGLGKLAKTDPIDAAVIGEYGRQARPRCLAPEPAYQRSLSAMVRRRDQITDLITAESNRLGRCHDSGVKKSLASSCRHLKRLQTCMEQAIRALVAEHADLMQRQKTAAATLRRTAGKGLPALPSGRQRSAVPTCQRMLRCHAPQFLRAVADAATHLLLQRGIGNRIPHGLRMPDRAWQRESKASWPAQRLLVAIV